jgi:hypothetical protein
LDAAEEKVFWVMVALLNKRKLAALFRPSSSLLQQCVDRLDFLLAKTLSLLHTHLTRALDPPFETTFYGVDWFSTLFAYSLPRPTASLVWDLFIGATEDDALFLAALGIM